MILHFSIGQIQVLGVESEEELHAVEAAAMRALPSFGQRFSGAVSWTLERRCARINKWEDYPEQNVTIIYSSFQLIEAEWRRLLRATCQRVLLAQSLIGLHAIATRYQAQTTLVAGSYGTGKSTIGVLLCRLGGKIISGDFVAVALSNRPKHVDVVGGTLPVLEREGQSRQRHDYDHSIRRMTKMAEPINAPEIASLLIYLEPNQRGRNMLSREGPEITRRTLNDLYINASSGFDQSLERLRLPLSVLNSCDDQVKRFALVEQLAQSVPVLRARGTATFLADYLSKRDN